MLAFDSLVPAPADRERRSPNQDDRPAGAHLRCIVLHATAGSDEGAESWMMAPQAEASAHLHIRRDGTVTRLVSDRKRAWHAGRSSWGGISDVNSISLGWEIGNDNRGEPYTDAQYARLRMLALHYIRQGFPVSGFVSHEEIALPKGRKSDPWGFSWARFTMGLPGDPAPAKPTPKPGDRRWSGYFREWVILTSYRSDSDWSFVRESELRQMGTKASAKWSDMPLHP